MDFRVQQSREIKPCFAENGNFCNPVKRLAKVCRQAMQATDFGSFKTAIFYRSAGEQNLTCGAPKKFGKRAYKTEKALESS